jgi:hypothetical protein
LIESAVSRLTVPLSGDNVGGFLLQRNIKIGRVVTFSRFRPNRYNAADSSLKLSRARGHDPSLPGSHDAAVGFSGA